MREGRRLACEIEIRGKKEQKRRKEKRNKEKNCNLKLFKKNTNGFS